MKFVKVRNYPNQWFWLVENQEDLNCSQLDICRWIYRASFAMTNSPDYAGSLKDGSKLLIREIGSYMTLSNNVILEQIESPRWPTDDYFGIVVCENDLYAPVEFFDMLKDTYPDINIYVLGLFDGRSDVELDGELDADYITFSTSFSDYGWYEKILDTIIRNCWGGRRIVGLTSNKNWESQMPPHIVKKQDIVWLTNDISIKLA